MRRVAALLALTLAAVGCGGGHDSRLDRAQHAMAGLDRGRIAFRLAASTPATKPVGFSLTGPFSMKGGDLPVFDLRYQRLLGGATDTTEVASTGSIVFVKTGDRVVEVPPQSAARMRLGDAGGGFADLGIAGWVEHGRETTAGGETTITGTVDVPDLLGDLARVIAQTDGRPAPALTGDQADALRALVRASSIRVLLHGDDPLPTSVHATIDFGGRVPTALRRALGRYAAASLDLTLQLRRLGSPLTVAPLR